VYTKPPGSAFSACDPSLEYTGLTLEHTEVALQYPVVLKRQLQCWI